MWFYSCYHCSRILRYLILPRTVWLGWLAQLARALYRIIEDLGSISWCLLRIIPNISRSKFYKYIKCWYSYQWINKNWSLFYFNMFISIFRFKLFMQISDKIFFQRQNLFQIIEYFIKMISMCYCVHRYSVVTSLPLF